MDDSVPSSSGPFGRRWTNILYLLTPPVSLLPVVAVLGVGVVAVAIVYGSPSCLYIGLVLMVALIVHFAALVVLALAVLDERGSL